MRDKENNFVSAVVCICEEDTDVTLFLEKLNNILWENFKNYEIICVDNEAGEDVLNEVKAFRKANEIKAFTIISMGFRHDLEAAMIAGVDLSIGDFVFEFDSCYTDYEDEVIMQVYNKVLEGFDIVAAIPPKGHSLCSSRAFYKIFNHFSESDVNLETERFLIISRRAINQTSAYSKTIPYRKAVYASSGLESSKVMYKASPIVTGNKGNSKERINMAIDSLVIFTNIAYKISFIVSIMMAVFMIITGSYTLVAYFGQNKPVEGWAPIMGLLSVAFFAIFVILTIVIKYLDILLRLVFKKKKYSISSIEKI